MSLSPVQPKYRADIDGLRAVAVLLVLGYHAFPDWVKGGFIGVDIFFVISGFLISTIIFENLERNSFSFAGFYNRRIRRIFPSLFVVLAGFFVLGWFLLLPDEYKQFGKHITGASAFVSNFMLWKESGYFDGSAELKPLLHLWSLGIEEQFYIFWPLILLAAWRWRRHLPKAIAAIALASFALNVWTARHNTVADFYSPLTRFWELLIGAGLAYMNHFKQSPLARMGIRNPNLQSAAGALLLGAGVGSITQAAAFPGWWALLPTLGAAFLILGGAGAWINRTILANRILVWFGLISYPLYLWHWPIFSFLHIVKGAELSRGVRLAALAASIVLAWLTYELLEKKIRHARSRAVPFALAGLMLACGIAGYACLQQDGIVSRFGDRAAILSNSRYFNGKTADDFFGNDSCFIVSEDYKGFDKNVCEKDKYPGRPRVFLIGDSHMMFLSLGLREFLDREKFNIYQFSVAHCTPLSLKDKREACREINGHVWDEIRTEKPDYVVLFAYYMNVPSDPDYGETLGYDDFVLQNTVDFKSAGVRRVLLLGPIPTWEGSLPQVLGRKFVVDGKDIPEWTSVGINPASLKWDQKVREKTYPPNVTYISLKDFLCNAGGCRTIVINGKNKDLLVFDYGHLTKQGAEYVTTNLLSNYFAQPGTTAASLK